MADEAQAMFAEIMDLQRRARAVEAQERETGWGGSEEWLAEG